MNRKDCEGCKDKGGEKGGCSWFNKTVTCPCADCLVKMMCIFPCELSNEYIIEICKDN